MIINITKAEQDALMEFWVNGEIETTDECFMELLESAYEKIANAKEDQFYQDEEFKVRQAYKDYGGNKCR